MFGLIWLNPSSRWKCVPKGTYLDDVTYQNLKQLKFAERDLNFPPLLKALSLNKIALSVCTLQVKQAQWDFQV